MEAALVGNLGTVFFLKDVDYRLATDGQGDYDSRLGGELDRRATGLDNIRVTIQDDFIFNFVVHYYPSKDSLG
jgi:hypothetical protein